MAPVPGRPDFAGWVDARRPTLWRSAWLLTGEHHRAEVADGSRTDPCDGVAYDLDRTQDVLLVRDGYGDVQVVSTEPCWPHALTGPRLYPSADLAETVAELFG